MRRVEPLLLCILAVGLVLRLLGLNWGLPSAEHYHSYHPDEIISLWAANAVNPLVGDFDPGFYNYGSLTFLLLRLLFDGVGVLWPVAADAAPWVLPARLHLIGRLWVALLGVGTLPLIFLAGRRMAGRTGGLVAAAVLALMPLHVAHSHYLTVDVPATFWTVAALCAALALLDGPRFRTALLAGALAGLAAATKYNAGLVLLAPLTALVVAAGRGAAAPVETPEGETSTARQPGLAWRLLRAVVAPGAACSAMAGFAFVLGSPGVLLNTPKFLQDFLYEARHVQEGHGLLFQNTLPGWIYHLTHSLRFGLGMPLLALALVSVVVAIRRRGGADLVLAAWVVPYYLLIGAAEVKFMRYALPLLPPLALWVGAAAAGWLDGKKWSRTRTAAGLALITVGFWSLGGATAYTLLFATPDPRDRAAAWVRENVRPGATVGLLSVPWFQHPPLVPWNGGTKTAQSFAQSEPEWEYALVVGHWTAARLRDEAPECFILSDLEVRDGLRLSLPETRDLVGAIEARYRKHEVRPIPVWPGLFAPDFPAEDWLYPAPTLHIYVRRDVP